MVIYLLILLGIILTAKYWIPTLFKYAGAIVFAPVIPFVIAYNIRKEKPITSYILTTIMVVNIVLVTLILLFLPA